MPRPTPEQELTQRIRRRFQKALKDYQLIEDGDKIVVGVSGGKDSLALLELLAMRGRIHKPSFTVIAAHVELTNIPYQADYDFLHSYAAQLGVDFFDIKSSFDASTDKRKSPCFLCSWNRRKALFTLAKEQGCNKIAIGHNMDDFIETMLMNITFQGAFSAMSPKMNMKKFSMSIIRPLCLVTEPDLEEYAHLKEYPPQIHNCPHERASNRAQMKNLLMQLEKLNPEARYNLWGSMSNVQTELLPPSINKKNTTII